MIQQLWIFSGRHRWWTNGRFKVTEEQGSNPSNFYWIQTCIYQDAGLVLCKDSFARWDWRPRVEMPRRTPAEITAILNET